MAEHEARAAAVRDAVIIEETKVLAAAVHGAFSRASRPEPARPRVGKCAPQLR